MLKRSLASAGFTLIELMIGLTVLGIILMIGLPSLATFIQNTQIRTAAEGIQSGLQLARAEALRRNTTVRFQLVDTLAATCVLSATGTNWVVSLADPTGACDIAPSDTTAPQIVQKKDGAEGAANATIAATGGSSVTFNGIGRVTGAGPITRVDIRNAKGGACKTAAADEPMRCLAVTISSGGQVRMCDPAVTDLTDPRAC
jgi:type IV fimbrial biogenesis protein FimT